MDMTLDKSDKIWLATNLSGLVELTPEGPKEHPINDQLVSNRLTGIAIDNEGRFWVRSKNGISRFDDTHVQNFTDSNGLPISDIRAFYQDFEGNIWLGTDGGGLMKYTGDAFSAYTTAEGLKSNLVMSIVRDHDENIWFSTFDQGVTRISPDGKATSFNRSEGLPNNTVWTSASTGDGTVWFGTSNGLGAFKDGKWSEYNTTDGLSHDKVIFIYQDNDSTLICGTNNGYTIYQNGNFKPIDGNSGFVNTKVRSIVRSGDQTLWLGTLNGVYAFDGVKYTNFNESNGLPDNTVYALSIDEQDRIWIGTADGLVVYKKDGTIQEVKLDDHYRSNTINFLVRDNNNYLWIGTNNGIYQINTEALNFDEQIDYRHYTIDDGIRSLETNLNAAYKDKDNKLWFGTAAGVLHCDLSELDELTNKVPPKVQITEVRLNLEPTNWNKFSDSIDPVTGLPINLKVGYKNNHFSFSYTGISNSDPQQVKYQYQMLGFDEDWQPLTNLDFATYTNLPYDDFEFQVKALSKNGIWSKPASFAFSIAPPFWLTWWFITLSSIALLLTFYSIYRYRRQNLITSLEKEKYEFQSKMLTLEQQSLNSSMNRHFIFNALNSIQYYINRKDRLSANIYLSNFAKLIRKNLDSSQSNFTSLQEEIERLELYLNLEHMRFKDKFEYSINIDTDVDTESIEVPAMLLQPFLENSIWHGILTKKELGVIKVNISKTQDGEILFSIQDNGIGIETSRREKLNTTGNHISKGMSITNGRIDLIRKMTRQNIKLEGPYEILKDHNTVAGTEVRIYLPIDIQNFYPN
jgi:streptogramin lyase/anti-sigma regulatory factor (Ser/Thr protein kinase)